MAVYYTLKRAGGTTFDVCGPPYTQVEEDAFYARYDAGMMSGKATILRRAIKQPVKPSKPDRPAE